MLNKMLQKAQTVAIGGHERPDGDCIGSCMGMYRYIKNNYPEIWNRLRINFALSVEQRIF